jgi:branched-subunit amino acid transport protein
MNAIEPSYFWTNIFFLMIGTISIRASIIAVSGKVEISDRWRELFSFIPAAILPAFVAPAVFLHQGSVEWAQGKERLLILILAAALCWITRSTLATIAFGLCALYLVTQVM